VGGLIDDMSWACTSVTQAHTCVQVQAVHVSGGSLSQLKVYRLPHLKFILYQLGIRSSCAASVAGIIRA
jgi:hypothetical protein